jgi:hypothetical protein
MESHRRHRSSEYLRGHFEEFVDEPILTPDATPAQPPHLALPNYVHHLIALNRSSRSLEFAKPLLGVHSPFQGTWSLLSKKCAKKMRKEFWPTPQTRSTALFKTLRFGATRRLASYHLPNE